MEETKTIAKIFRNDANNQMFHAYKEELLKKIEESLKDADISKYTALTVLGADVIEHRLFYDKTWKVITPQKECEIVVLEEMNDEVFLRLLDFIPYLELLNLLDQRNKIYYD